ncbi:efflux RND transporter periplasmic adaptor subunit [Sphingomonas sp. R86520]|uniref:efflux RND transporter periplasmic adaptor subunit n=1 Tax=Sphingomonas sp. R86520 TaxID=3093859 RepID=UPI0036D28C7E
MTVLSDLMRPPTAEPSPLGTLLTWEASLRSQASVPELLYFVANETRRLVSYDQLFVLKRAPAGEGWQVAVASSLAAVDRNAPAIRAIEAAVKTLDVSQPLMLDAPDDDALADYPFRAWLWQPLIDREGQVFAGLLVVRADPFEANEAGRIARMAETTQHGWLALTGGKPVRRVPKFSAKQKKLIAGAVAVVALFPVHMSALAPVEVVAAHPYVVTAPFAGLITTLDVAPSAKVAKGQTLLRFDDVKLRNELSLSAERLQVARAKVDEVSSASFGDAREARGISIAQAEYQLAAAEHGYAQDMLARARVTAPRAGMAIYTDRREWEGRAVEVGQPIMEIADPTQVRYRIDLPTREQMTLEPGSSVSVWLDSQPLWAQSATLADASYQARPTADGTLAFALNATPADGAQPRIGSRGTARVRGDWAPLAYTMLKRPIASARQYLGF